MVLFLISLALVISPGLLGPLMYPSTLPVTASTTLCDPDQELVGENPVLHSDCLTEPETLQALGYCLLKRRPRVKPSRASDIEGDHPKAMRSCLQSPSIPVLIYNNDPFPRTSKGNETDGFFFSFLMIKDRSDRN